MANVTPQDFLPWTWWCGVLPTWPRQSCPGRWSSRFHSIQLGTVYPRWSRLWCPGTAAVAAGYSHRRPAGSSRPSSGRVWVSRDWWDWILWVVNSANDNTCMNLSFSTLRTWTGQDPMVSFPDPGFYPAIGGTMVLHLFVSLIALKSCGGLRRKGV